MKPSRIWGFSVPRAAIYDISRVHNIIFAHRTVFCDVSFFTLTLSTTSYAIILSGSAETVKATTSRSYNSEMAAASSEPRLCSCVSNYLRVITPYSPLTSRQRCSSNFMETSWMAPGTMMTTHTSYRRPCYLAFNNQESVRKPRPKAPTENANNTNHR
jgi:hypothetical protein